MNEPKDTQNNRQPAPDHWILAEELFARADVSGKTGYMAIRDLGFEGRKRSNDRRKIYYDPAWADAISQWAINH